MDHVKIGERVKKARKRAGLLQADLAKKAKITQATVSRIETGKRGMRLDDAAAIATALGCTIDALTGKRESRAA